MRESIGLDLDQVALLDDRLAGRLSGLTARKAANLARHHALSIDPKAAYERARANRSDRFVSLFPDWTLVNRDGTVIWQTPTGHQYLSQRRPVLEYHYQGTSHLRQ